MSFASIRRSSIIAVLVTAMVGLFGAAGVATAAPAPATAQAAAQSAVTPLTGTFTDATGGTGTVTGTFTPGSTGRRNTV